jgi:N-ethylmaleimide reductase
MTLLNRIVMAPMTRNRAGAGNVPGLNAATYYAQRASAGLVITESIQVSPAGQSYPATPGLHTEEQVKGWRTAVRSVHAAGGLIVAQLCHGGRISHPLIQPDGATPLAPSAIKPDGQIFGPDWKKHDSVKPEALDEAGIAAIIAEFAQAAENARAAGFDGVEIHAGNGYLIDQFLCEGSNRRDDGYGGAPANRARFLAEVVEAVSQVMGPDRTGVRVSPWNAFNDMSDSAPEKLFPIAGKALSRFGLAYLHVIEPVGTKNPIARKIADAAQTKLIVNSGYDGDTAAHAVKTGGADAVSFAKHFIANPDLPARIAHNLPLAEADRETYYGGGAKGYTDYPAVARGDDALSPVRQSA